MAAQSMKIEDALIHITCWAAAYQELAPDTKTAEEEYGRVLAALMQLVPVTSLQAFHNRLDSIEKGVGYLRMLHSNEL